MRPYLVPMAVALLAVAAYGQQPVPWIYGPCLYGCGPYVPMVTTPEISFQNYSPNPVGASNATTGLIAGATNSTLSEIQGSTSSTTTVGVWYQGGGAPMISPQINLWPETINREGHPVRNTVRDGGYREDRSPAAPGQQSTGRGVWMFFTGTEHSASVVQSAIAAKGGKKAARVYTNDDVARQNDTNGTVKYDGKTEKI